MHSKVWVGRTVTAAIGAIALMLSAQGVPAASATPRGVVVPRAVGDPPPDNYVPTEGLLFNHPFRSDRGQINRHIVRMIRSTAAGHSIKIATFGIASRTIVDAMIGARNRGVSIQIIGDSHLIDRKHPLYSKSFVRLRKALGQNKSAPSFAIVCNRSCRGSGGNMHAKYYLFDEVSGVKNIVTTASGNLTTRATRGQWNHAKTVFDQTAYDQLVAVFDEMVRDVPSPVQPIAFSNAPFGNAWVFPFPGLSFATDPVATELAKVQCMITNPDGSVRRTKIRISMYAWLETRGINLARQVRGLWNDGCDIAILVGVGSKTTRSILRSGAGRGAIPAQRVAIHNSVGELVTYLHHKWVTVQGMYDGDPNANLVISGTCNFASLGNVSDEFTTIYQSKADADAYNDDFAALWRERTPRAWRMMPGYVGRWPAEESDDPKLGVGKYKYAETD